MTRTQVLKEIETLVTAHTPKEGEVDLENLAGIIQERLLDIIEEESEEEEEEEDEEDEEEEE